VGTGFGESLQVTFNGVGTTVTRPNGLVYASVPDFPVGSTLAVVAVNPEGCRSQQAVTLSVAPFVPTGCGLLGIEPLVLPGVLYALGKRRRSAAERTGPSGPSVTKPA
jgi:hypothetical protein